MQFACIKEHLMHTQILTHTHSQSHTQPQIHANQLVSLLWGWRECVKRNCKPRRKCFLSDLRTRFSTDCETPKSISLSLQYFSPLSFTQPLPPLLLESRSHKSNRQHYFDIFTKRLIISNVLPIEQPWHTHNNALVRPAQTHQNTNVIRSELININ